MLRERIPDFIDGMPKELNERPNCRSATVKVNDSEGIENILFTYTHTPSLPLSSDNLSSTKQYMNLNALSRSLMLTDDPYLPIAEGLLMTASGLTEESYSVKEGHALVLLHWMCRQYARCSRQLKQNVIEGLCFDAGRKRMIMDSDMRGKAVQLESE